MTFKVDGQLKQPCTLKTYRLQLLESNEVVGWVLGSFLGCCLLTDPRCDLPAEQKGKKCQATASVVFALQMKHLSRSLSQILSVYLILFHQSILCL